MSHLAGPVKARMIMMRWTTRSMISKMNLMNLMMTHWKYPKEKNLLHKDSTRYAIVVLTIATE